MFNIDVILSQLSVTLMDALLKAFFILLVFLAMWIVDVIVVALVRNIWKYLGIEKMLKKEKLQDALLGISLRDIIEKIIGLYLFILALAISGDIANIPVLSEWGLGLLNYFPALVQGLLIIVVSLFVGDYIGDRIRQSEFVLSAFVGTLIQIFIVYIGLTIALPAILPAIDTKILENAFVAIIAGVAFGLSIGLGVGIGLGSKPTIEEMIKKNKKKIEKLF